MKPNSSKNDEILKAIEKGDPQIILKLYRQSLPNIKRYVLHNSGRAEDAEDLFQEAMVIVYEKIIKKELVLSSSLATYLFNL